MSEGDDANMNAQPDAKAEALADVHALCDALLALKTRDEAHRFLRDLCTPAEVAALAERWRIASLLDAGGLSYRAIAAETGASTTTVARVARFLRAEPHNGYRNILDRMKTTKSQSSPETSND